MESCAAQFLSQALPEIHTWTGRPQESDLEALPACPAVYLFLDADGRPVQLATTQHLRRQAVSRLLQSADAPATKRADLAEIARAVRWRETHSAFEGRWRYYQLARETHPKEYRDLIGFGPAWFLNVDWRTPVPEIRVTEKAWCAAGECVGPWPTRAACQKALEGLWDLFDLCRYPEQVRQAPAGKRCVYAEMGRCDAPCDGAAPLAAYAERNRTAWRFAIDGEILAQWIEDAARRMMRAAAEQRYEHAGQIKQQIAFAQMWQKQWGVARQPVMLLDDWNFFLAVPVTRRKAWKLFLFWRGDLRDGPVLKEKDLPAKAAAWLREQPVQEFSAAAPHRVPDAVRMEQTWLAAHFLCHKEAETALIVWLPRDMATVELDEALRRRLVEKTQNQM